MHNKTGTFDKLVAGLSLDDRLAMLHQVKSQIKPEIKFLEKDIRKDELDMKSIESLKKESLFLRIILAIKTLFSNKTKVELYADYQLQRMTKITGAKYPEYFNTQERCLEKGFYDVLEELTAIADFFKPGVVLSDEKQGDFLILLGSLILTDLEKRIEDEANPYNTRFSPDIPPNLRISLLRKIEGILAGVSSIDKDKLYTCVKSLTWLRDFCELPFESFKNKFTKQVNGKMHCALSDCKNEIEQFSSILCNSKNIEPEILEAIYLFSIQTKLDQGKEVDIQNEIENHMASSLLSLKNLIFFINTVPFKSFYKISKYSLTAAPLYNKNTEDWFVMYKDQWKKRFDEKWSNWQHDRNIAITRKRITNLCNVPDYPLLPNRPWKKLHVFFERDYTIGFLYSFIENCYSSYKEVLKELIMNGEFIISDNRTELMDTFTDFNVLSQKITTFNDKLSIDGTYGTSFNQFKQETLYTIQGKSHMKNLFLTLIAEIDVLVLNFLRNLKSFNTVLDGILIANYNTSYDGIANLASLKLHDKTLIRNHLVNIKNAFIESEIIIKDLASIELRGKQEDEK